MGSHFPVSCYDNVITYKTYQYWCKKNKNKKIHKINHPQFSNFI